jgi:histidinol-phosphate phosphatase family protein
MELRAPLEQPVRALLCDRDGTLVADVPYNGDPGRVQPLTGVARALDRARRAGLAIGMVTNQSGLARGHFGWADLLATLDRCDELLGPFDVIVACPHDQEARCSCRKPAPGMIRSAASVLDIPTAACVVVGDTGADVDAARAAGARSILVPNQVTRPEETARAPVVAPTFAAAVDLVLRWRAASGPRVRSSARARSRLNALEAG